MVKFKDDQDQGIPVLRIDGAVLHRDGPAMRSALERFSAENRAASLLIVELSGLELICSAGMCSLVQAERAAKASGRRLVIAGLRGEVRETVELAGVSNLLTMAPTLSDARRMAKCQTSCAKRPA